MAAGFITAGMMTEEGLPGLGMITAEDTGIRAEQRNGTDMILMTADAIPTEMVITGREAVNTGRTHTAEETAILIGRRIEEPENAGGNPMKEAENLLDAVPMNGNPIRGEIARSTAAERMTGLRLPIGRDMAA